MYNQLIQSLDKISSVASGSKFERLVHNPVNYIFAIGYRAIIYPITQKPFHKSVKLFWGSHLTVALPSGIDMYILGAKAEDSEIRLSKYLINNLSSGDLFIDVGAHYGYYSKLAAYLIGSKGQVIACEPSKLAFQILRQNTEFDSNIESHEVLLGSQLDEVTFYEFPTKYAEYNSIDIDQYKNLDWFNQSLISESQRDSVTLDSLSNGRKIDFIKIDVEGSEYEVILGAQKIIQSDFPTISMEYVHSDRSNYAHRTAVEHLRSWGYQSNIISSLGGLNSVEDLDQSLSERHLKSDNFIFTH